MTGPWGSPSLLVMAGVALALNIGCLSSGQASGLLKSQVFFYGPWKGEC